MAKKPMKSFCSAMVRYGSATESMSGYTIRYEGKIKACRSGTGRNDRQNPSGKVKEVSDLQH